MKGLVDGARRDLRSAFESDEYAAKRDETVRSSSGSTTSISGSSMCGRSRKGSSSRRRRSVS